MVRRWVRAHWDKVYVVALILLFMKLAVEDAYTSNYWGLGISTFCLFYFARYLRITIIAWIQEEQKHATGQFHKTD